MGLIGFRDPALRAALTECFEHVGCTVVAAADGLEGKKRLDGALQPCLVLLDLNMPHLTGAELAAFIRAHPCHRDLPTVSMSAGAEQLEPPDVVCHECKPFDFFTRMVPLIEQYCRDPEWLHGAKLAASSGGRATKS